MTPAMNTAAYKAINEGRARAMWRRGGAPLWLGVPLLVFMIAASLWASRAAPEVNRADFSKEPPHPAVVRWLLTSSAVVDTVCTKSVGGFGGDCRESERPLLGAAPTPVVRVGHPFKFVPSTPAGTSTWSMQGAPDGLRVDSASGFVFGKPATVGHYSVQLTAILGDESRINRRFELFVDDRFLLLGADRFGEDIFRNAARSAQFMVLPGLLTVLVGVFAGVLVGALAGFYGGVTRRALLAATAALQSVPGLLLVFLAASASGFDRLVVMLVVGLTLLPETALGVMERVQFFRRRDFVDAARELGLSDRTILWNEIIWHNARDFVLNRVANGFMFAVLMEVTLSYVQLLDPHSASLGNMLRTGRKAAAGGGEYAEAIAALIGLAFVLITFTLLDRGVRAAWARPR
jgi:peptide/nickel transport system permease protein